MGFSSLIPKTVGRRSIDNIVVPRELLHIVREKEHRFPSFLALWSKKEGRDYSPKELPLCIHMARKCKNTKKNTKNNHLNLCLLDGVREDGVWENRRNKKIFRSPWKKSYSLSPGAPPAPVRLSGQKIFEEKFSPFQWTGRWKFATNGGSSQHFYRHLKASKIVQIESREDSKTTS